MKRQGSRVIKRILKDHFDEFWKLNERRFPASYRDVGRILVEEYLKYVNII